MGFTSDVLTATAQDLAGAGIGTWNPDGVYVKGAWGIFLKVVPANPDRLITLSLYPVVTDHQGAGTIGLNIRCRAPEHPTAVDDDADTIYTHLQGRETFDLGPAHVSLAWRQSHTTLGRDSDGRWETSSNYYLTTAQHGTHTE